MGGERYRQARKKHGLTQAKLAALVGLSPSAISALERDETAAPNQAAFERLCDVLQVSADWIMGLSDDPSPRMPSQPHKSVNPLTDPWSAVETAIRQAAHPGITEDQIQMVLRAVRAQLDTDKGST